ALHPPFGCRPGEDTSAVVGLTYQASEQDGAADGVGAIHAPCWLRFASRSPRRTRKMAASRRRIARGRCAGLLHRKGLPILQVPVRLVVDEIYECRSRGSTALRKPRGTIYRQALAR